MELQAGDVRVQISTVMSSPQESDWKDIVCREDTTISITTPINKRKTFCGPKVGVGEPEVSISGSGAAEKSPSTGMISHKELLAIQMAKAPFLLRVKDADGSGLFVQVTAYFAELSFDLAVDEAVGFSFQIENSGTVDTTP